MRSRRALRVCVRHERGCATVKSGRPTNVRGGSATVVRVRWGWVRNERGCGGPVGVERHLTWAGEGLEDGAGEGAEAGAKWRAGGAAR